MAAVLLGLLLWFFWPASPAPEALVARPVPQVPATPTAGAAPRASLPEPPPAGESRLAEELNAPAGTIRRDLQILNEVFETWQSNFPRSGNPVGENVEITRALTGANELRLALIPTGHRAINARGQLCDRWGTPFRFHQLSGQQMEIRSAGPDRVFNTSDDAAFSPESPVLR
jgi:hypothetical protein